MGERWDYPRFRLICLRRQALHNNDIQQVKLLRNRLKKAIRSAKTKYANKLQSDFRLTDSKAWRSLKDFLKLRNDSTKCHLPPDDLNTFYTRFEQQEPPAILPPLNNNLDNSITLNDVTLCLRGIDAKKSAGPDGITAKLAKIAADILAAPLVTLFNDALSLGLFPTIWKKSTIVPIPKAKGASTAKDFRPVALTSVIAKVFEKLLLRFITPYITDPTQFAYRSQRCTEDALMLLLDTVSHHLDADSKNYVRCVYIDFTSAFNTISPATLVSKMCNLNMESNIINLVYSFLTNYLDRSWALKTCHNLYRKSSGLCDEPTAILSVHSRHERGHK